MPSIYVIAPALIGACLVYCCVRLRRLLGRAFLILYVFACFVGATGAFVMLRVGLVESSAFTSTVFAASFFGFAILLARVRKHLWVS